MNDLAEAKMDVNETNTEMGERKTEMGIMPGEGEYSGRGKLPWNREVWKRIDQFSKGDYLAVPNKLPLLAKKSKYSEDFAYIAGLIASDGHIKLNSKQAQTSFYNSDKLLVSLYKEKLSLLTATLPTDYHLRSTLLH